MRVFTSLITLSIFILLSSCLALPFDTAFSWTIQVVDVNGAKQSGTCPIVIDSNNTPHIAYTRFINGTYYVMYASWNDSGFSAQTVAEGAFVWSLELDINNNPHILYNNIYAQNRPLMYAIWAGANWQIENTGINEGYGALAIDTSGKPHIAYISGGVIKYASWSGTNWKIQNIDNSSEGSGISSLAFDSNNTAHILYHTPSTYQDNSTNVTYQAISVKLATLRDSTWGLQTVPLPPTIGDISNLVLDSKGCPHFTCTQDYRSSVDARLVYTVLYASWDGSTWRTQTVASNLPVQIYGIPPSGFLSLDSKDNPHIASFIAGLSRLTYYSWTGTTWHIQTEDLDPEALGPCYLAVDANSNPKISYPGLSGERYNAPLMYATGTETSLTPEPTPSQAIPVVNILIATVGVVILAVVAVAYIWKKKKVGWKHR